MRLTHALLILMLLQVEAGSKWEDFQAVLLAADDKALQDVPEASM